MFPNVDTPQHRIIGDYRRSTDKSGEETLKFLMSNCRRICKYHSFSTFKELTLNYRILFNRRNKLKIIQDYKKHILAKTTIHKSNLAISYNMIAHIGVDQELENQIVDFMYAQLPDSPLDKYRNINTHFLKKHFVMNYVKDKFLTKEPI
jgi:hypothetical protein